MVLDGEGFLTLAVDAFVGIIVEVQVGQLDVLAFQGVHIDAETVVLAGDFDVACHEVLDRVVGAPVAELELVSFGAECE